MLHNSRRTVLIYEVSVIMTDSVRLDELKRRLRKLKHLEEKLRFGGRSPDKGRLVWDSFFDARGESGGYARYPLLRLDTMSKAEYKAVVDEYFAYVYYELYKENGLVFPEGNYNPALLKKLGLPPDAGAQDIRWKFRELAKKYHPDTGGDAARFIELMETYRQLIDGK